MKEDQKEHLDEQTLHEYIYSPADTEEEFKGSSRDLELEFEVLVTPLFNDEEKISNHSFENKIMTPAPTRKVTLGFLNPRNRAILSRVNSNYRERVADYNRMFSLVGVNKNACLQELDDLLRELQALEESNKQSKVSCLLLPAACLIISILIYFLITRLNRNLDDLSIRWGNNCEEEVKDSNQDETCLLGHSLRGNTRWKPEFNRSALSENCLFLVDDFKDVCNQKRGIYIVIGLILVASIMLTAGQCSSSRAVCGDFIACLRNIRFTEIKPLIDLKPADAVRLSRFWSTHGLGKGTVSLKKLTSEQIANELLFLRERVAEL